MKKTSLIIIILSAIFLQSCQLKELFWDVNTTDNISSVSVKPLMQLVGEPIISLPVGGTYVEEGVLSSQVQLGDNDLKDSTKIVAGNVDVNQAGFYSVKYRAVNDFGWSSTVFRAVLVYSGNPDNYDDITHSFKQGVGVSVFGTMDVTKNSIKGYWNFTNIYLYDKILPAVVADLGDGINYKIVPGYSSTYGFYQGYIIRELKTDGVTTKKLKMTIYFVGDDGIEGSATNVYWDYKN